MIGPIQGTSINESRKTLEKILTILLTVAIPGLFIFYMVKGAMTIGRFALLFGLGIFVASLYVGGRTENGLLISQEP